MIHLLGQAALGFLIGALAKFAVYQSSVNDWILFGLVGCAGAVLGTRLARITFGLENHKAGWIFSVLGAVTMLTVSYFYKK